MYLSSSAKKVPKVKLQLVGITALLIVSKVEEIFAVSMNELLYIS
jgi:Cyclin, N-terminal domain